MKYYSTRDKGKLAPHALKDAAFMGLAPDGGLFVPERIPAVDMAAVESAAEKSYADMACYLAVSVTKWHSIPLWDLWLGYHNHERNAILFALLTYS